MESRISLFLLKPLLTLLLAASVTACSWIRDRDEPVYSESEPVIKPELDRRTINEADIDSEDFELGAYAGVLSIEDFGSNAVYGVRAAYHITEDFFAEGSLGTSQAGKTSYETLSGGTQLLTSSQRDLVYYNLSVGYNLLPGESFIGGKHAFNSALYLVTGVGNAEFADESHFTVNLGAGYRFLVNDWVALHLDFKDHMFNSDLLGSDKMTHNLEATLGCSLFF